MRNIDRVYNSMKLQPLTSHNVSELLGISISQATSYITTLLYEGKIDIVGNERVNGRLRRIYKAKKYAPSFNQLKKMYERVDRLRNVPFREYPFSKDEMHYGKDGKKWSWQDVETEAKTIYYHPESSKNRLPIIVR